MPTFDEITQRVGALYTQVRSKMSAGAGANRDRIKGILEALGDAWASPPSSGQLDTAADEVKGGIVKVVGSVMKKLLNAQGFPTVGAEVPTPACGGGGGALSALAFAGYAGDNAPDRVIAVGVPGTIRAIFFYEKLAGSGTAGYIVLPDDVNYYDLQAGFAPVAPR